MRDGGRRAGGGAPLSAREQPAVPMTVEQMRAVKSYTSPLRRPVGTTRPIAGAKPSEGRSLRDERGRADERIRTADPFITSEVLYQLSYVGVLRGNASSRPIHRQITSTA